MEKTRVYANNYYTEAEFEFEQGLIMEYLHKVTNDFILLYKVDKQATSSGSIYGETKTKDKVFFPKRELPAKVNIGQEDPRFQTNGIGYSEMLNIDFAIPELALRQNNLSIDIGDYVRWQDRFYEVTKLQNIAEASKFSKNYKNKMRKYYGIMAKEDSLPVVFLLDNEIN